MFLGIFLIISGCGDLVLFCCCYTNTLAGSNWGMRLCSSSYTSKSQCFVDGSQDRISWQESESGNLRGTFPVVSLSDSFVFLLSCLPCEKSDREWWFSLDWDLLYQLTIKTISHRHCHRPTQYRQFLN